MEKIKQALERARQEREAVADAGAVTRPAPVPSASTPAGIRYTKTRVVDVDRELLKEKRVIGGMNTDQVTDAYRMLRTRVLQVLEKNRWKSLAITSPGPGEGKTLTAINLAISLAREVNHTVLLVDLDLRRPSVHEFFGYQPAAGIGDYLYGDVPLSEILFSPSIERLVVLPGREAYQNSSEVLSTPRMVELVEDITTRYPERIVLFDMPPVLMVDDALAFSPFVDAFLVVVEEGRTETKGLRDTREILGQANVIGTVLNKAEDRPTYY